jgi:hypothetical protein
MCGDPGPFFNLSAAAEYCTYSKSYFEKLIRGSGLPRYGKKKSRFLRDDLVRWMKNPSAFLEAKKPAAPRALLPKPEV